MDIGIFFLILRDDVFGFVIKERCLSLLEGKEGGDDVREGEIGEVGVFLRLKRGESLWDIVWFVCNKGWVWGIENREE